MKKLLGILFTVAVVASLGWYVSYKNNKYGICKTPTDKSKIGTHLLCWPGIHVPQNTVLDGVNPFKTGLTEFMKADKHKF